MLTQADLKKLLHYDRETGAFTWALKFCKKVRVGGVAGTAQHGYVRIAILGTFYYAHRLAWLYMQGRWPVDQIDHINGVRSDNRWVNLREATNSTNQQNLRKAKKHNQQGLLGVTKNRRGFSARIRTNGVTKHLGTYRTIELAHAAYIQAKRNIHECCEI